MNESVDSGNPAPGADSLDKSLKAFVRDQVEAVKIARTEAEAPNHQRRLDACYLAMRYLDDLNGGTHGGHTPESVITVARRFEAYLGEP